METTVRTLNRLTLMLAVAAIVLITHSKAVAQTVLLQFTNPLQLTLVNGGGTTSANVPVTLSTVPTTSPSSVTIQGISVNSGANWLCASTSGATITVSAGTACAGASTLSAGSYSGIITFTAA